MVPSWGFVFVYWIGHIFNNPKTEISLTLSAAYISFILAEGFCGVSGVLAVVALGLYFGAAGRVYISPEVEEFLHSFWSTLAHQANTVIFSSRGWSASWDMQRGQPWDRVTF